MEPLTAAALSLWLDVMPLAEYAVGVAISTRLQAAFNLSENNWRNFASLSLTMRMQ